MKKMIDVLSCLKTKKKGNVVLGATILPLLAISIPLVLLIAVGSTILVCGVSAISTILVIKSKNKPVKEVVEEKQEETVEEKQEETVEEKQEEVVEEQQEEVVEEQQEEAVEEKQEEAVEEKQEEVVEEKQEETVEESREILNVSELDDSEEVTEADEQVEEETETSETFEELVTARISKDTGRMILIRYKKSFSARLNLAEDVVKDYHSAVKNKLLSYKKIKCRVSWNYEAYNFGRTQAAKMNVRGKSLFLYLALDPKEYVDSKYSFQDCSHIKKYEQLPFRVKIKSNRGLKYAFELIEMVMEKLETTESKNFELVNYFEKNRGFDRLLSEELIKEIIDEETFKDLTEINKEFLESSKIRSIDLDTIKELKFSDDVFATVVTTTEGSGKKDIINLDTISKYFNNNDVVSVETLKSKKLIPNNVGSVKCLARGTLDKRLTFELQSYSKDSIKMILITGGKIQ